MALTKVSGSILKDPLNLGEVSIGGTLTYQDVTNVDSLGIGTFRTGINVSGGQLDVGSNIKLGNAGVITATSFSGSGANLTSLPAQATIANNADNRVITGGSGVNLNGEANLTFDGTKLNITTGGAGFRITRNSQYIELDGNTGNGGDQALATSAGFRVQTGGVGNSYERLRITSAGNIGMGGNTNPTNVLHIKTAVTNTAVATIESTATNSYPLLRLKNDAREYQLTCHGGLSDAFTIYDGTSAAHRLLITSAGLVGINHNTSGASTNAPLTIQNSTGSSATRFNLVNSGSSGVESTQIYSQNNDLAFVAGASERLRIASDGKLFVDRTHASATTGNHPALDIDTYANGTAGSTFATGIDFRVAGVHKKRMVVTNGSGTGGGDWIFYRDNGNNIGMQISSAGQVTKPANPMFKAVRTSSQLISSVGWHVIQFNSDSATGCFDVGGNYNTSNYRFTAPVTGYYQFGLNQRIDGGDTSYFRVALTVNDGGLGSQYPYGHAIYRDSDGFSYYTFSITSLIYLTAGQYVKANAYSNSDTNWYLQDESIFYGYLVG